MIDYEWLKDTLTSIVRNYVYPRQLNYESSLTTSDYPTLRQAFYPFSSSISNVKVYVKSVVGSPGNATVRLLDKDLNVKATAAKTLSTGWNTVSISKSNLVSKQLYYIEIKHGGNSINHYVLGASTVKVYSNTLYTPSSTLNVNLAFEVDIGDKVYKVFPGRELGIEDYPVVVCDLSSRPRVYQRYMDPKTVEEVVTASFNIYSRYPSEIDKIARLVERGIFRERRNISDVFLVSPGALGPITRMRENIFSRAITFNLRMFIKVE